MVGRSVALLAAENVSLTVGFCLLVVVASSAGAYASPGFSLAKKEVYQDVCSRNMPCGWAICRWTADANNVDAEQCAIIKNPCRCLNGHICSIDLDTMEPPSSERPFYKYEYLCRKQSRIISFLTSK